MRLPVVAASHRLWVMLMGASAVGLVLVAVAFRCVWLENLPGVNGDEAWYGVQALQILRGEPFRLQTPTGNPVNPLFLGPLVLLHLVFCPSITLLRSVAVGSGLAALAVNWLLCRWVFDRRTAAISTIALAVLPINIAYSRFAWDASQSLAVTLPVVYCSLAAIRFRAWQGRLLAAAVAAQIIAALVHPTNLFAGAAIAAVLADRLRWVDWKSLRCGSRRWMRIVLGAGLAAILLAIFAVAWLGAGNPSRIVARMGGLGEVTAPGATAQFFILYARLFAGGTVYAFLSGSHSWLQWPGAHTSQGFGADVALVWILLVAAAWMLCRSWKRDSREEDRVLFAAWAFESIAFLLIAGPHALEPGWERFAICLVGPTVLVIARGVALLIDAAQQRSRYVLAAISLAGWLMLADYQRHYFAFIERTGGTAHATFRTASVEPKRAALAVVLQHRGSGPTWIIASEWWNYWPLRYLAPAGEDVRVLTAEEARNDPRCAAAARAGQVWYVEFRASRAAAEVRNTLAGGELREWFIQDYGGRHVICVLHPLGLQARRTGETGVLRPLGTFGKTDAQGTDGPGSYGGLRP